LGKARPSSLEREGEKKRASEVWLRKQEKEDPAAHELGGKKIPTIVRGLIRFRRR